MFSRKKAKSGNILNLLAFFMGLLALLLALYVRLHDSRQLKNHEKIAVINGEKLWKELPAIQSLNKETNALLGRQQQALSKLEAELRNENQNLLTLQNSAQSQDYKRQKEIETRQKAFTNQVIALQTRAESAQRQINTRYQKAMDQIKAHVMRTISRIASREGYAMVIYKDQAPFYNSTLDITDKVFSQLEGFTIPTPHGS